MFCFNGGEEKKSGRHIERMWQGNVWENKMEIAIAICSSVVAR